MKAVSDVFRLSLHLVLVAMFRLMNNADESFWSLALENVIIVVWWDSEETDFKLKKNKRGSLGDMNSWKQRIPISFSISLCSFALSSPIPFHYILFKNYSSWIFAIIAVFELETKCITCRTFKFEHAIHKGGMEQTFISDFSVLKLFILDFKSCNYMMISDVFQKWCFIHRTSDIYWKF